MPETVETMGYFAPPEHTFWKWADDGAVITTRDDETIVFTPELCDVIARLGPQGLPPLGALLMVLAACRHYTLDDAMEQAGLTIEVSLHLAMEEMEAQEHEGLLGEVLACLAVVHRAWKSIQERAGAKANVTAAVFSGLTSLPQYTETRSLIQVLEQRSGGREVHLRNTVGCRSQFLYELGLVRRALHGTTAEALQQRVQTGLDDVIVAVEVEPLPPATSTRDLLRTLETDEELSGMARLAKQVLATLNLPRAISDPDELPDGGLSDITNRGSLDRLLLSELAHDDLTLAVRVALREALYLRREAPPRTPPRQRTLLIDCGLRLWGVPRLFATSVAMAIASASEQHFDVSIYRTAGQTTSAVNFRDRAGLLEHLAALDHRLHPAAALRQLVATLAENSDDAVELVLVTSDDAWSDHDFQRELAKLPLGSLFVVTINREGQYRLIARSGAGSRVLREATFALEDILSSRARSTGDLLAPHRPDDLPEIFRHSPCPLRLSAPVSADRAWHVPVFGVLSLTKDGRLLRWNHPGHGGKQLAERMPSGSVQWCATLGLRHYAVVGRLKAGSLFVLVIDLRTSQVTVHPLRLAHEQPRGVAGQGGTIFVVYDTRCEVFDAESGQRVCDQQFKHLGVTWQRDRFFVKTVDPAPFRQWYALTYTMDQCVFEPIYHELERKSSLVTLIQHEDEGPVAVFKHGEVEFLGSQRRWKFLPAAKVVGVVSAVSRDNQWFVFSYHAEPPAIPVLVNLKTAAIVSYREKTHQYLEPVLPQFARPRVLRQGFNAITVDSAKRLTLISRGGDLWSLQLSADRKSIQLPKRPQRPAKQVNEGAQVHWLRRESSDSSPYNLRYARWADGSQAVLDARGLLHLRSSDVSLPEFTIVLAEGDTAGWVADGRRWGPSYFTDCEPASTAAEIYQTLLERFVERLL